METPSLFPSTLPWKQEFWLLIYTSYNTPNAVHISKCSTRTQKTFQSSQWQKECIFIPLNLFSFPWMYFHSPECIFIPLNLFSFPWMYFNSPECIFIPLNVFSFPWMYFYSPECIFIPLNVFSFPWMFFLSPKCIFIPLNVLSCPEMYFPLRSHLKSEIDFYWPSNIFVC